MSSSTSELLLYIEFLLAHSLDLLHYLRVDVVLLVPDSADAGVSVLCHPGLRDKDNRESPLLYNHHQR